MTDLDVKIDEIDQEVMTCRKFTENSLNSVTEHVGNIKTSLAKDIEQIRVKIKQKPRASKELRVPYAGYDTTYRQ